MQSICGIRVNSVYLSQVFPGSSSPVIHQPETEDERLSELHADCQDRDSNVGLQIHNYRHANYFTPETYYRDQGKSLLAQRAKCMGKNLSQGRGVAQSDEIGKHMGAPCSYGIAVGVVA